MARTTTRDWLFALVCVFVGTVLGTVHAQRGRSPIATPRRATAEVVEAQQWVINLDAVGGEKFVHIQIIDTTGVCLYVYQASDSAIYGSVAAIPKTQLPKGVGCQ